MAAPVRRGPLIRLFAVDQLLGALLAETMADGPLRPDDFAVYSWLRLVGPVTPSQLAADLGLRQPTLSNRLSRMLAQQHLLREANPADGRSVLVSLTPAGRAVTEACFPGFARAFEGFQQNLSLGFDEVEVVLAAIEDALVTARAGLRPQVLPAGTGARS